MTKRGVEVEVDELPRCEMCGAEARYDAATKDGWSGFLCDPCFGLVGLGLGPGRGVRLTLPGWRTYRIVRMYFEDDQPTQVVRTGLTLAEAQAHCRDRETSSSTATSADALAHTRRMGQWFDGYEAE